MKWSKTIRETGLIEHVCEHDVGHPDPKSVRELNSKTGQKSWGVHGCDGCCIGSDFPGLEKHYESMLKWDSYLTCLDYSKYAIKVVDAEEGSS